MAGCCHQSSRSRTASAALSSGRNATEESANRSRRSHSAKFGTGDSVTKFESAGSSREISSTTCLIKKLPKETPANPRWQLEIE